MKSGQNAFSKVGTQAEKKEIFDTLSLVHPKIFVFAKNLRRLVFKIESVYDRKVTAKLVEGDYDEEGETVTVNFSVRTHQYFIRTPMSMMVPRSERRFYFDFTNDVFRLQRRANFRVKIPESCNLDVLFYEINDEPVKQIYRLADLSAGGMALLIPQDKILSMNPQQTCRGILRFGHDRQIELSCRLCYQRPAKGYRRANSVAGMQFLNLSPKAEQFVLSLVMDIYRGLFSVE